jgi:hypothetical protein
MLIRQASGIFLRACGLVGLFAFFDALFGWVYATLQSPYVKSLFVAALVLGIATLLFIEWVSRRYGAAEDYCSIEDNQLIELEEATAHHPDLRRMIAPWLDELQHRDVAAVLNEVARREARKNLETKQAIIAGMRERFKSAE